jgi:hypothetical protein
MKTKQSSEAEAVSTKDIRAGLTCLQLGFGVRIPRVLELSTHAAERTGPVEVVDVDTFLSNKAVKRNRRVYFTQTSSNEYAIGATMPVCRLSRLNSTIPIVVLVDRPVSVDALAFLKSIPDTHLVRVTNPGRIASTKNETRVGTYNKDASRFENVVLFKVNTVFQPREKSPEYGG